MPTQPGRNLPSRAPIVRYAIATMLAVGLGAVACAAFLPSELTPYLIFGAVGLTGGLCWFMPTPSQDFGLWQGRLPLASGS